MENEFEQKYGTDDFNKEEGVVSQDTVQEDDLVSAGSQSQAYDITKAPKTSRGPERENLDGKEVIISKMTLDLPGTNIPWQTSKDGKVKMKNCMFKLFYDNDGQAENYSGVKVFDRTKDGVQKYSDPAIQNGPNTQASTLKMAYAAFKGKVVEEVSLHEFFAFLSSKPKAVLISKEFEYEKKFTKKNIVEKFI